MRGIRLYCLYASPRIQFSKCLSFIKHLEVRVQCEGDPENVAIWSAHPDTTAFWLLQGLQFPKGGQAAEIHATEMVWVRRRRTGGISGGPGYRGGCPHRFSPLNTREKSSLCWTESQYWFSLDKQFVILCDSRHALILFFFISICIDWFYSLFSQVGQILG